MKKIFSSLTGFLILLSSVSPAFAANWKFRIKNNGADSDNKIEFESNSVHKKNQTNFSYTRNLIGVRSNTGHNQANKNTGSGDVSIDTGDVFTGVVITNQGNTNETTDECGCQPEPDVNVKIADNGADSDNDIEFESNSFRLKVQESMSKRLSALELKLNTGHNETDKNTSSDDGDLSIVTGNVDVAIEITNEGNVNSL